MGSVALDESFKNRPDHKTQHDEWVKWYHRHKFLNWCVTHKRVITWDNEFIAPLEFSGSWIEIRDIPYSGVEWDFKKKSAFVISVEKVNRITKELDKILDLLLWDVGWYLPAIMQIDDKGQCHLLTVTDYSKEDDGVEPFTRSMDMILRTGTEQWVKINPDDEEENT